MLTEYRPPAGHEFWSGHWRRHPVEELLAIARRSPLTTLITRALPSSGTIREAGCGTGQYVLLLRERGWRVAGADWVVEPLAACRRVAPVPLAAMKLEELAVRDGALAGYISLGAVEGGRRLIAPWLRRRSRAVTEHGGTFYQFVFTRRELWAALARHGFSPMSSAPYDPARLLRKALPGGLARRRAAIRRRAAAATVPVTPAGEGAARPLACVGRAALRRLLYSQPALRLFGHMLLAVAVKR